MTPWSRKLVCCQLVKVKSKGSSTKMQLIGHHWKINDTEMNEHTDVISDENDLIYISPPNYTNASGFTSLKARPNHSCRSSSAEAWPCHRRGRFPFHTGSKLIAVPTTQQLSWDESVMTSHWFSSPPQPWCHRRRTSVTWPQMLKS